MSRLRFDGPRAVCDERLDRASRARQLVQALAARGPLSPAELAERLQLSAGHTRALVRALVATGAIQPAPGRLGYGRGGRLPTRYQVAAARV